MTTPWRVVLCIASYAASSLAAVLMAQGSPPAAPGSVADRVRVDATVRDGGRPVSGLVADDFVVTDNGVRQRVEFAAQAGGVSVAMVFANSGVFGMDEQQQLVRAAQRAVVLLRPGDRVELVIPADRLQLVRPPGTNPAAVQAL